MVIVPPGDEVLKTVEYALREARDSRAELGTSVVVEVFLLEQSEGAKIDTKTRKMVKQTVSTFDDSEEVRTTVRTLPLDGGDSFARIETLLNHIGDVPPDRIVISGKADIPVERLREVYGITHVELTASGVEHKRRRLLHPGGVSRLLTIFGLTYLFYVAIGGFTGGLDLLTGAISAAVVAVSLSHVALSTAPRVRRTGPRLGRMLVFLPVLLWEIVKANFIIAYVILHPRLPIDPSMGTVDTETTEGLERMVLANSITLTPGTLTIDVQDREFTIHSLTVEAKEDVKEGRLERLVAWVFHGGDEPQPSDGERET